MGRRNLTRWLFGLLPLAALVALLVLVLLLAGDLETDSSRLARWSPWLFTGALAALGVLLGAIVAQSAALLGQWRRRVPGSRLAMRWTLALVLLAVPPVLLVYGFALRFLTGSIDAWFNVRIEAALDDALELGRIYVSDETAAARAAADETAAELGASPRSDWQDVLDASVDRKGLSLGVFDRSGSTIAHAAADPRLLLPTPPEAETLLRVLDGAVEAGSEPLGDDLVLRVVLRLDADTVLQATYALPARVQPLARNIEASWYDYQRLSFLRNSLNLTFALILTVVLALSVLLAVLVALRVARRQAAPVARLAEATQRVAAGDFSAELPQGSDDEIGFLTASFNQMTRDLDEAGRRARASQAESERQRRYLATVLGGLSSGVVTVGTDGRIGTANPAAATILGITADALTGLAVGELAARDAALAPLGALLAARSAEGAPEWREEIKLTRADGEAQLLMLRGALLPDDAGLVVVLDDRTVLDAAQREAAWSEVARRLAHEVKNPLTPIQLAAERLQLRLKGKLAEADASVLDKATTTIVAQVDALKTLVNAFGDYARPPQLKLARVDLGALVGEVLDLYEQAGPVVITRDFDALRPAVRADAGRLRQLVVNLVKNALEASGGQARPALDVRIATVDDGARVLLEFADRGLGLPAGFDIGWFEPYRTSKAKGTGLGLAIVRKVVDEVGGEVSATNRDGGGAVFSVRLPRFA